MAPEFGFHDLVQRVGSYVGVPNCCRVPNFECVCHIPVPTVGLEVVFRGGVHTPPSAPGFRNRCPSRRLDPELGAHLQNIKPPPFGTRRRNPGTRCRAVHPDQPSGADAGTRIRRGHENHPSQLGASTFGPECALRVSLFVPSIPNAAHKVGKHKAWVTRSHFRRRVPNSCNGFWVPGCDAEVRMRVQTAGIDLCFRFGVRGAGSGSDFPEF